MNKTNEIESLLRQAKDETYKAWHSFIEAKVMEFGEVELRDENEEDEAPYIYTPDENHGYCYHCSFDRMKMVDEYDEKALAFHVKDGDGLFDDDSWQTERMFSDFAYEELFDWISWPDE